MSYTVVCIKVWTASFPRFWKNHHNPKRAHSKKKHIPKTAHSKSGTFQKKYIPKTGNTKNSTFQKKDIPKGAHSKKNTFQKEHIPKRAHLEFCYWISQTMTTYLVNYDAFSAPHSELPSLPSKPWFRFLIFQLFENIPTKMLLLCIAQIVEAPIATYVKWLWVLVEHYTHCV